MMKKNRNEFSKLVYSFAISHMTIHVLVHEKCKFQDTRSYTMLENVFNKLNVGKQQFK